MSRQARQARRESRKAKKRVGKVKSAIKKIGAAAGKVAGMTPAGLAVKMLKNPERNKKVKNYVRRRGEKPRETEEELATQALLLRNGEIEERAEEEVEHERVNTPNTDEGYQPENPDFEEIEEEIMEEEEESFNFTGESENFLDPSTLAAVKAAGAKGIAAINKNRAKKGKPPIFSKVNKKLANKIAGVKTTPEEDSVLKQTGKELVDEITKQKKKEEIKKMMPFIILLALGLIAVTAAVVHYSGKDK